MDTVGAAGHRIAYDVAGKGPPVVLLHGYVGDRRMWRPQMEGLSDEFTVVAWDAPGYGGSSDPPEDFPSSWNSHRRHVIVVSDAPAGRRG